MHIEDLIISLMLSTVKPNMWDQKIIFSFAEQINLNNGFTEKQRSLATTILKKYSAKLSVDIHQNILGFVENPTFRLPLRTVNNNKQISIITDSRWIKTLKVEFPYNENYVSIIKANKYSSGNNIWDREEKSWKVPLTESNIHFLYENFKSEGFTFDEEFMSYIEDINVIIANMELFVPMLSIEDNVPKFKNCHRSVGELKTTDLLEAVFEARKKGIVTWDQAISNFIESDEVDEITRTFLSSDPSTVTDIDMTKQPISCLAQIIKNMSPCLVVVPGGSEFDKLLLSYKFFKSLDIDDTQMSVMFRLPAATGKKFNDFIKDSKLNSPITDKTKVVFISSKLPKPVLKSGIKFHTMLDLGMNNVHYTMRDFIKVNENVLHYSETPQP
jgi:DNA-binding cell septation regulator SpoVG